MADRLKTKHPCCQSKVRCKRCPVVLKRLERDGLAKRKGKRTYVLLAATRADIKAARVR